MPRVNRRVCHWGGHTFDSAFEMEFAKHLTDLGIKWEYCPDTFVWYPKPKTYVPDFKVYLADGSHFYVETKGFFYKSARDKMDRVHEMHPDVDIRYVFMKAKNKLNSRAKKRPTTYAMWCDKRNLLWSEKIFPEEWRKSRKKLDAEREEQKPKQKRKRKNLSKGDQEVPTRTKARRPRRRKRGNDSSTESLPKKKNRT